MALLQQYDPPAFLSDFDAIPGQREAWHRYVQARMSDAARSVRSVLSVPTSGPFLDATTVDPGVLIEQDILWNAFPSELQRSCIDRFDAFAAAERTVPLSKVARSGSSTEPYPETVSCRGGTEYCEWHVDKDADDKTLRRITFTTEGPEYWQAMWGGGLPIDGLRRTAFPGSRKKVLELYRALVDPGVQMRDLAVHKPFNSPLGQLTVGAYNPYNKWNVERGIVHLTAQPNQLMAEIFLAAYASRCFQDEDGRLATQAEVISTGANVGAVNRNSDMAIVGGINALARQGRRLTLANPVGIYIDHIDLAGWTFPGKLTPADCVRVVRGVGRSITRLVVDMPDKRYSLGSIRIGGERVTSGGQIAECVTVRLRAAASVARDFVAVPCPLTQRGFVEASGGREVQMPGVTPTAPPGMVPAFGRSPTAATTHIPMPCGCPR